MERARWRFFPQSIARRELDRSRERHELRDKQATDEACLPSGERVGVPCVWITELFLASHIENLYSGIRNLRLDADTARAHNPVDWIRKSRTNAGGYLSLGPIVREDARLLLHGVRGKPPKGGRSITLSVHPILPGVTALVAQFLFDDDAAYSIETPFSLHVTTTAKVEGRWIVYAEGTTLRSEAIEGAREELIRRCTRWMGENFAGFFEEAHSSSRPVCELLTLEIGDPLHGRTPPYYDEQKRLIHAGPRPTSEPGNPDTRKPRNYMSILGIDNEVFLYASPAIGGLTLVLHEPFARTGSEERMRIVFSVNISSFKFPPYHGPPSPRNIAHYLDCLHPTLALYALWQSLREVEMRLSGARDALGAVRIHRTGKALKAIRRIEAELVATHRDGRALMRSLCATAPEWFEDNVYEFFSVDERRHLEGGLMEWIRGDVAKRAANLLAEEQEVRGTAQNLSAMVLGSANLRTARWNIILQVIAILMAALAALLAGLAIPPVWRLFLEWSARA